MFNVVQTKIPRKAQEETHCTKKKVQQKIAKTKIPTFKKNLSKPLNNSN